MAWELTGNPGTSPTVDFVGTTDNQPLAIRTNGTEHLRIDTSGKVGIGTANPSYNLHVAGSTGTDIRVEGTTNPRFSINQTSGGADQKRWQNYATTNSLNFSALNDTENSENFWMQVHRGAGTAISSVVFPNGNVGIGTASPQSILEAHVNSPGTLGPILNLTNSADLSTNPDKVDGTAAAIDLNTNIGLPWALPPLPPPHVGGYIPSTRIMAVTRKTGSGPGAFANDIVILSSGLPSPSAHAAISTPVGDTPAVPGPIVHSPALVERMRITPTGVGIGTSTPSYNLHVAGSTGTDIRVEGTTNPRFSINQTEGGVDQKRWQNYATTNSLNFSALNDAENSENFWMQVHRGPGTSISSVAFPNGKVAIGTANPAYNLHVAGSAGTDIRVEGTTNPRFSINQPSGGAVQKRWQNYATTNSLNFSALNDAENSQNFWMQVHRGAGTAISSVVFPNGNLGIGENTPASKLHVAGDVTVTGDILLTGADCAEQFDAFESQLPDPGTVVVIDEPGSLRESREPYDKKVAGVVSGAGDYKPAIVLHKKLSQKPHAMLALVGKVYCKVDAAYSPIEVGDLLTTSPTPGHAMKAADPLKAFGAVIGKALRAHDSGRGLIPILISLQ